MERLLDLKQAEEVTGIKARTWRYYAHTGRVKAVRGPKHKILLSESTLERFIRSLPQVGGGKNSCER